MYGYYEQLNYASGNTFLDSFAQYRQSLGLAASVLSVGPIDEVRFVSRTPPTRETLLQNSSALLIAKLRGHYATGYRRSLANYESK